MDEYDIGALQEIIDEIDRDIIIDINPEISLLKELVKLVDDIDVDELLNKMKSMTILEKDFLIFLHIDELSEGIDILESLQTNLEKFIKAMDILNIEHNIDIDEFNTALEKISKTYNKIESESEI